MDLALELEFVKALGVTDHCDSISHIVHAIRGVCPWLNNNSGSSRKVEGADLRLHILVGQTGSFHSFHVVGINVGMLSFDMLLPGNLVIVKIDNELEQLIVVAASFDDHLNPGVPSRNLSYRLLVMLLLEVGDHLLLGRLQKGDDSKVRVLPSKVRADEPRSLEMALIQHMHEERLQGRKREGH